MTRDKYSHISENDCSVDLVAIAGLRRQLAVGEEELVPSHVVERLLNDENPIRVWREHRGLTVKSLAEIICVAPAYLSQLETGKRDGTVKTIQKIATALNLKLDDLVS